MAQVLCSRPILCLIVMVMLTFNNGALCDVVFHPSFLVESGPKALAFLVGNVSGISFSLSTVSPSNTTGSIPSPSCVPPQETQWNLTHEAIGKNALLLRLNLRRSLQLCRNDSSLSDCCLEQLCVQETLLVSACADGMLKASLVIQSQIYAQLLPDQPPSENKTVIPNQVFEPLGRCPCDVSPDQCDIRCCCDQDCTVPVLQLFAAWCLPGPFGGSFSPAPDYQCSAQSSENHPDWFPFFCVTSPSDNNPYLGLFYSGSSISPDSRASFQASEMMAAVPPSNYRQGDPIFTKDDQYFTIPQSSGAGQCVEKAPVGFLGSFDSQCVQRLRSCPSPSDDLRVDVRDGWGDLVRVRVVEEVSDDLTRFLSGSPEPPSERQQCENVVVALRYTLYWKENGLTAITVTRSTANISVPVSLTRRYSAVFVNGNETAQPYSGNPGYQVRRLLIAGDALCSSADLRPALFGINSTSGCLIPVSLQNMSRCSLLRETVRSVLDGLVTATLVSTTGNPDFSTLEDWVNITTWQQNSSRAAEGDSAECSDVPSHLHIHVKSGTTGTVQRVPQVLIQALEISFIQMTWRMECGVGAADPCLNPELTQNFPVTSSVTFTDNSLFTRPPRSRFSINFTELDCDRNHVCWPELLFPLTRSYTGEPFSQALAKGLLLIFFVIAASVLGRPCRQIRQAISSGWA
ncbi:hypothetical protein DNTS_005195 [Danionella cerebrum]|uniref:Uncharacterized protein n=1 Tax=Danionella cerebrum TaxID=2873325 RepID=A0A553QV13_9TELE|nr:hypothetical protein DNTS_005195 [Danionella translucida]